MLQIQALTNFNQTELKIYDPNRELFKTQTRVGKTETLKVFRTRKMIYYHRVLYEAKELLPLGIPVSYFFLTSRDSRKMNNKKERQRKKE